MMDKERLSIRKYAKTLCIDESTVRQAMRTGKIKNGFDLEVKKIIPSIANLEYGHLHLGKRKIAKNIKKQKSNRVLRDELATDEKTVLNLLDAICQKLDRIEISLNRI